MKRSIVLTKDGATTIRIEDWKENYHSSNGAIQEAKHVFIKNGLQQCHDFEAVSILEIGFGTGLNAFVTFLENKDKKPLFYTGIEAYPITKEEVAALNFVSVLEAQEFQATWEQIHESEWEKPIALSTKFTLTKRKQFFETISEKEHYNLIYFDAFGFPVQPELWSETIFKKMFDALQPNGILVTYACRTIIKNNMKAAGFTIEKLPGAPGKREMLRARKPL